MNKSKIIIFNNEDSQSNEPGGPALGDIPQCKVWIKENKEFHNFVDRLMYNANTSLLVGSQSWSSQFKDAITLRANDGFVFLFVFIIAACRRATDMFQSFHALYHNALEVNVCVHSSYR